MQRQLKFEASGGSRRREVLMGAMGLLAPAFASTPPANGDPLDTPATSSRLATRRTLHAVARVEGDTCLAVGMRGHALLTSDAGRSWRQVGIPVSCDLLSVQFVSPELGFIAGHDGVVLRSTDRGETWSKVLDGRRAALLMLDQYKASLAEADATQARADEPGLQRALADAQDMVSAGPERPFFQVHFTSPQVGYVVGAFNTIFRTADGGTTWVSLFDKVANPQAFSLHAIAAGEPGLFIVGEQGIILRHDPVRDSFDALTSPYSGSLFGVMVHGESVLTYGLRGRAFVSRDSGRSWTPIPAGVGTAITAAAVAAPGRLMLASQGGDLLLGDESKLQAVPLPRPMAINGVLAVTPELAIVVGSAGVDTVRLP